MMDIISLVCTNIAELGEDDDDDDDEIDSQIHKFLSSNKSKFSLSFKIFGGFNFLDSPELKILPISRKRRKGNYGRIKSLKIFNQTKPKITSIYILRKAQNLTAKKLIFQENLGFLSQQVQPKKLLNGGGGRKDNFMSRRLYP